MIKNYYLPLAHVSKIKINLYDAKAYNELKKLPAFTEAIDN